MQRNLVTLKVWCPNDTSYSFKSQGHVALEIINPKTDVKTYISFWPGFACSSSYFDPNNKTDPNYGKEGFQTICNNNEDHIHDADQDELIYKRPADKQYVLKDLSPALIEAEYNRRLKLGLTWKLHSSVLYLKNDNIANCSSLVYDLLIHAGFNNIVDQKTRLTMGVAQTAKKGIVLGSLSALLISPGLLDFAINYSSRIVNLRVHSKVDQCWHHFQFPYKPGLQEVFATLRRIPHNSFKIDATLPSNKLLKFLYLMHNRNYYAFSSHAKLKAKSSTIAYITLFSALMTASYLTFLKTTSNHAIVKPTDFVDWLDTLNDGKASTQAENEEEIKRSPVENVPKLTGYPTHGLFSPIAPSAIKKPSINEDKSIAPARQSFCTLL